jgi:hypothetical protein
MPPPSPLLGFNNNVKHRGRVFHIQTEDSGIKHPHVITHLFADGGRILKTVKTSYAEHLGSEKLVETIRELMKRQHKDMFIALRDGQFDVVMGIAPAAASGAPSAASQAPPLPPPRPPSTSQWTLEAVKVAAEPSPAIAPAAGRPAQRQQAPDLFARKSSPDLPVDVAALERAALAAQTPHPAIVPTSDLPPPPASVLAKKPDGGYRGESPSVDRVPARDSGAPAGRYAASRPANIFAAGRPNERTSSIFGEDLISEKSLDEVILSYLAEDLDADPKK